MTSEGRIPGASGFTTADVRTEPPTKEELKKTWMTMLDWTPPHIVVHPDAFEYLTGRKPGEEKVER